MGCGGKKINFSVCRSADPSVAAVRIRRLRRAAETGAAAAAVEGVGTTNRATNQKRRTNHPLAAGASTAVAAGVQRTCTAAAAAVAAVESAATVTGAAAAVAVLRRVRCNQMQWAVETSETATDWAGGGDAEPTSVVTVTGGDETETTNANRY